jgi:hypothetical protein
MKLIISRRQEKKKVTSQGYAYNRFYLAMKIEFTSEEEELLKRFNFIGDDNYVGKARWGSMLDSTAVERSKGMRQPFEHGDK